MISMAHFYQKDFIEILFKSNNLYFAKNKEK